MQAATLLQRPAGQGRLQRTASPAMRPGAATGRAGAATERQLASRWARPSRLFLAAASAGQPAPSGRPRQRTAAVAAATSLTLQELLREAAGVAAGVAGAAQLELKGARPPPDPEPSDGDGEDPPPPRASPKAQHVVMVGAECAPWSKTGGLGDVMQALPKALAARGHRMMVVAPRYKRYRGIRDTGARLSLHAFGEEQEVAFFHTRIDEVDYVLVDHPAFLDCGDNIYGGSRQDVLFRCALLSRAALEVPLRVPCGRGRKPYGEDNLLYVSNDWHTALLPVYLQAHYRDHGKLQYARTLLVLHNMAHQGRGPPTDFYMLDLPDSYVPLFSMQDPDDREWMTNVLKAGAVTAHRIVAVSSRYAQELQTPEHGWGLDEVLRSQAWKLTGVVNGIDTREWSPAVDTHLRGDGYCNYRTASLVEGKARCKAALQKELGLPVDPDVPLLGFIGRLDFQKGVDLIRDNYDWLMEQGAQLVLLGSGRDDLEAALREMEERNPQQCRSWVGFSVKLAHRITAGCDLLLMPSRFEPCGLNQLYAQAYGTPPIVHAVGGLVDTVEPFHPFDNTGTGWSFEGADPWALRQAIDYALHTYRDHKRCFRGIQLRGMSQDLSWGAAAEKYEEVLMEAKYQW